MLRNAQVAFNVSSILIAKNCSFVKHGLGGRGVFLRWKRRGSSLNAVIVKSVREGSKIKQRCVAHLASFPLELRTGEDARRAVRAHAQALSRLEGLHLPYRPHTNALKALKAGLPYDPFAGGSWKYKR